MKERYEGPEGTRRLREALLSQKIVLGNAAIAEDLAGSNLDLMEKHKDDILIEQDGEDDDLYLILSGSFRIIVNGKKVGIRHAENHVGEMAALEAGQKRSASVVADSASAVVLRVPEAKLTQLATTHPEIWRRLARELARRLEERNRFISLPHDRIRLFVISSKEAKDVAKCIESTFEHEDFDTQLWTNDVFKVAHYTLDDLDEEIEKSDFAVAVASGDDILESRAETWPAPRDNVIFELGLFMGRLGRKRAFLMEPRGENVKLPSDLAGITTIPYKSGPLHELPRLLGPACTKLRTQILRLGKRD